MSEVKGTLLTIVLAISMFSIVYALIQVAMNESSKQVAQRMTDASGLEPNIDINTKLAYTYHL